MKEMMEYLKVRYLSEKGQGLVEYALLLVFVVGVAVVVLNTDLTTSIKAAFNKVTSKLN
jgi:pilus assembly protein Flp/PilA